MLQRLQRAWWQRRLADPAYAFLGEAYAGDELVSIDCETSGLDVRRDQILSIGAIKKTEEIEKLAKRIRDRIRRY